MFRIARSLLVAFAAVALLATSAAAQDMTTGDVQRLEQTADQINADLVKLRQRDRTAARSLQAELAELEEEVTYLEVRFRRERTVYARTTCDVRDRLEDLRNRVTGNEGSPEATARLRTNTILLLRTWNSPAWFRRARSWMSDSSGR